MYSARKYALGVRRDERAVSINSSAKTMISLLGRRATVASRKTRRSGLNSSDDIGTATVLVDMEVKRAKNTTI
jgi:hypothetical protein